MRSLYVILAGVLLASPVLGAEQGQVLGIEISTEKTSFVRGETDPAKDLKVRLKVTNTSDVIPISFPKPDLAPTTELKFHVLRVGSPTGEKYKVPLRVKAIRRPSLVTASETLPVVDVALKPQGSETFVLNIGSVYDFDAAGQYEISAEFRHAKSEKITISHEITEHHSCKSVLSLHFLLPGVGAVVSPKYITPHNFKVLAELVLHLPLPLKG